MMRKVVTSTAFKKDLKRARKRGQDLSKLGKITSLLEQDAPLPWRCHDHFLVGNWSSHRECHIELDCLLIYRLEEDMLILDRTGSHADLFG
jgi:mRNA interferase YafQ